MAKFSKDEKGNITIKLSTGIAIMSGIIAVMCVIIAGASQSVFVEQVSFASTLSSIILSVLAIWLSMQGEKENNAIKVEIMETAKSVNDSASNMTQAVDAMNKLINDNAALSKDIKEEIHELCGWTQNVLKDVNETKKSVEEMFSRTSSEQNQDNMGYIEVYNRIYKMFNDNGKRCFNIILKYKICNRDKNSKLEMTLSELKILSDYLENKEGKENDICASVFIGLTVAVLGKDVLEDSNKATKLEQIVNGNLQNDCMDKFDYQSCYRQFLRNKEE